MEPSLAVTNPNPYDFKVHHGSGSWLFLSRGGEADWYVDGASGIAVNNLGHRYSEITEAVSEQISDYAHTMVYGEFDQEQQALYAQELAEEFSSRLRGDPSDPVQVWFTNSGAEANDTALKLAHLYRQHSRKNKPYRSFLSVKGGFHGRSIGSLGVTYRPKYRKPFENLYSDRYCDWISPDKIQEELSDYLGFADAPSAFIFELIRGEDGVAPLSPEIVQTIDRVLEKSSTLAIVDEVQTGFGRTGSLFAVDQFNFKPHIVTLGKAVGGGFPLGACVTRKSIMEMFSRHYPFSHLSTFGGHPVSCAAGRVMLKGVKEVIDEVPFGLFWQDMWDTLQEIEGLTVTGSGPMIGLHFDTSEAADKFIESAWANFIFVGHVLHDERTVRLYLPLNVYKDVPDIIQTLKTTLEGVVK